MKRTKLLFILAGLTSFTAMASMSPHLEFHGKLLKKTSSHVTLLLNHKRVRFPKKSMLETQAEVGDTVTVLAKIPTKKSGKRNR